MELTGTTIIGNKPRHDLLQGYINELTHILLYDFLNKDALTFFTKSSGKGNLPDAILYKSRCQQIKSSQA